MYGNDYKCRRFPETVNRKRSSVCIRADSERYDRMETVGKMEDCSLCTLNVANSTVHGCSCDITSSTQSSTSGVHLIPDDERTTDDGTGAVDGGGITCCQSWPSLLLLVLVAAGITGNTLVCCAVAVERKLRNVTNYFLVSLAVADLLVSMVVMPSCIAHDVIGRITLILVF